MFLCGTLLFGVASAGSLPDGYPSSHGKAVAHFDIENGGSITGSVVVKPFQVEVNLDISENFDFGDLPADCADAGLKYHIHAKWSSEEDSEFGSQCGPDFTGGHWDPTIGCSGASGNPFCKDCVGGSTGVSVLENTGSYQCSADNYAKDIFACEVSDYSGKFGLYTPGSGKQRYADRWGIPPALLDNLSVVFHCSTAGAPRLACAKLSVTNQDDARYPNKFRNSPEVAVADFSDAGVEGTVRIFGGKYQIDMDLSAVASDIADVASDCMDNGLKYHIHRWNYGENDKDAYFGGDACGATNTGGHWDPTIACSGATNNALCVNKGGCVAQSSAVAIDSEAYQCSSDTYKEMPYACEVSDLSGKFGLAAVEGNKISLEYEDPLLPPVEEMTSAISPLSVVFHCSSSGAPRVLCAKINRVTPCFEHESIDDCDADDNCASVSRKGVFKKCAAKTACEDNKSKEDCDADANCETFVKRNRSKDDRVKCKRRKL